MPSLRLSALGPRRKPGGQPIEYSLLLTATLCLLAFGVVMVFSASSTTALLGQSGDSAYYLKRTVLFGVVGLVVMRVLAGRGLRAVSAMAPAILVVSLGLLLAVLVPGVGISANGAQRWIGAGLIQVQPSEIAKVALVLYGAYMLTREPRMVRSVREMTPYLTAVGVVCLLVVVEPDLGTAMVACFTAAALLTAAGARMRDLAIVGGAIGFVVLCAVLLEPYRMARLTGFLDPTADPSGAGFQAIQAKIALGSGGVMGVGLGESLQKAFYLPEAHTDMIAAVIGEELGLAGITVLVGLYGLFGYAGLRTAQRARDRYGKLLAAGLTSLVMVQAVVNLFAVLGLAPLTGVPLPFVSYGNSSMLVMLAAVGLLLNVAAGGTAGIKATSRSGSRSAPRRSASRRPRAATAGDGTLRVVGGAKRPPKRRTAQTRRTATGGKSGGRGGRDRRSRGAGAGRRRSAAR